MSRESDNNCAVGFLTQSAGCAVNVIVNLSGANYNFPTVGCCKESAGFFGVDNSDSGDSMLCHNRIRHIHRLTRCANSESIVVCFLDNLEVCIIQKVMSVSVTFPPTVSTSEFRNFIGVDVTVTIMRQIT